MPIQVRKIPNSRRLNVGKLHEKYLVLIPLREEYAEAYAKGTLSILDILKIQVAEISNQI